MTCECADQNIIYPSQFFVPSFTGWQTARNLTIGDDGSKGAWRMLPYASNKYEFVKSPDGSEVETFTVGGLIGGVVITSEQGVPESRRWVNGMTWLPGEVCKNKPQLNYFEWCYEQEVDYFNCSQTQTLPYHCGLFDSRIAYYPSKDYGYKVGVVESIVKVDTLDDGSFEHYWYGRGRGLLRFEALDRNGVVQHWVQVTETVLNSPITPHYCFLP
jgi:hypothetical protein